MLDALLADNGFSNAIAPALVLRGNAETTRAGVGPSLSSFTTPGGPVYCLGKPCNEAGAEPGHPWWNVKSDARVCHDAYRPEVRGDGTRKHRCGGSFLATSKVCGCGAYLGHCTLDEASAREVVKSELDEVKDTIAAVVRDDQPIAQAFLSNESVRKRSAEFRYRRWRIERGQAPKDILDDLDAWPADKGVRAPRYEAFPGAHAGILTAPNTQLVEDAPRAILRRIYDQAWCAEPASVNVTTDAVLRLPGRDLRQGEGWKQLAAMPVCNTCHARLDYGVQFFSGFTSRIYSSDFVPEQHPSGAKGPLFYAGIDDRIGESELTPHGFATLVTDHPRFGECMMLDVSRHVFHGEASPEDMKALEKTWMERPTLRALMRTALLRFAQREMDAARLPGHADPTSPTMAASPPPSPAEGDAASPVAIDATLHGELEASCTECHSSAPLDFRAAQLSPDVVRKMLSDVAFRRMPRSKFGLANVERRKMVDRSCWAALGPDQVSAWKPAAPLSSSWRGFEDSRCTPCARR